MKYSAPGSTETRRKRTLLGGSAIALACAVSMPAFAATPTEGPLFRVGAGSIFTKCTADNVAGQPGSNYPNTEVEPNLAINPSNPSNLLVGVQQDRWTNGGSRGLRGNVSTDGGATWTPTSTPNVTKCQNGPWNRSSDPWVTFSPDGTAYFSELVVDELANANHYGLNGQTVSRSTDGGVTWGPPTTLIVNQPNKLGKPQRLNDKNAITADVTDSQHVYTVWDQLDAFTPGFGEVDLTGGGGGDVLSITRALRERARDSGFALAAAAAGFPTFVTGKTWFSRTTDGGTTWEASRVIYNPGANYQTIANQVVSLPNGRIIDFFTRQNDLTGADQIGLVISADKGATWGPAILPLDIVNTGAVVTPNKQEPIRSSDILFSVTADARTGVIYVVWQDTRFTGVPEVSMAWTQDGQQWTAPFRINQTPRNPNHPLFQQAIIPTVTTTADGTAVVTYYDFRNDKVGASSDNADHWAVFCNPINSPDGCTSNADWSTELRVTDHSFDYDNAPVAGAGHFLGDYEGLKANGQTAHPVFARAVGPNLTNLYTRAITVPAVP